MSPLPPSHGGMYTVLSLQRGALRLRAGVPPPARSLGLWSLEKASQKGPKGAATQDSQVFSIWTNWGTQQVLVKPFPRFPSSAVTFSPGRWCLAQVLGDSGKSRSISGLTSCRLGLRGLETICSLRLAEQPLPTVQCQFNVNFH